MLSLTVILLIEETTICTPGPLLHWERATKRGWRRTVADADAVADTDGVAGGDAVADGDADADANADAAVIQTARVSSQGTNKAQIKEMLIN